MYGEVYAKIDPQDQDHELQVADEAEIYRVLEAFARRAIQFKNKTDLHIISGQFNRASLPRPPLIILQTINEERLSLNESCYTARHKIIHNYTKICVQVDFYGTESIKAHKMAKAFEMRFNDDWAYNLFKEESQNTIFNLYSQNLRNSLFIDSESQYADRYTMDVFLEYHPEYGMCQESAIELRMPLIPVTNTP